jgi:hypothetical protein
MSTQPIASGDDPGFAPSDLTDGRSDGQWASRYPDRKARVRIALEAGYLALLLLALPLLMVAAYVNDWDWLSGNAHHQAIVRTYALIYIGGAFGGALFATKWMYHCVAHGYWNADRTLWRLFAPFLSAGTAVTVSLLIRSRVLPILDDKLITSAVGSLALAIFVGYFSDKATGRLNQLADRIFGKSKKVK